VWDTLVALASEQLVAPALSTALRQLDLVDILPSEAVDYFDGLATLNRQRNARVCAEAVALVHRLNGVGVVPVLLKGGANLLSGLYADPAFRVMVDLDVLVPVERISDCAAALHRHGYHVLFDSGFPAHHHYPALGQAGAAASVELHVEVLDRSCSRLLGPAEVFATAASVETEGTRFAVPSPEHRLIHTIAHVQLANLDYILGRLALRELLDFALLSRAFAGAIDWDDIARRFSEHRGATALSFHSLAAQDLLGVRTPVRLRGGKVARILYWRAKRQADQPELLGLTVWLLRPLVLLIRALSRAPLRRRLLRNMTDPVWYRRQWSIIRGR